MPLDWAPAEEALVGASYNRQCVSIFFVSIERVFPDPSATIWNCFETIHICPCQAQTCTIIAWSLDLHLPNQQLTFFDRFCLLFIPRLRNAVQWQKLERISHRICAFPSEARGDFRNWLVAELRTRLEGCDEKLPSYTKYELWDWRFQSNMRRTTVSRWNTCKVHQQVLANITDLQSPCRLGWLSYGREESWVYLDRTNAWGLSGIWVIFALMGLVALLRHVASLRWFLHHWQQRQDLMLELLTARNSSCGTQRAYKSIEWEISGVFSLAFFQSFTRSVRITLSSPTPLESTELTMDLCSDIQKPWRSLSVT